MEAATGDGASTTTTGRAGPEGGGRRVGRWLLGAFLLVAGTGHLTFARQEFQAQVPPWLPMPGPVDADTVVVASGVVELAAGAAVLLAPERHRRSVGWALAALFVAVFPGNVAQYTEARDAFGLDTDAARLVRLLFQPPLVLWALWSTGAWPRTGISGRGRPGPP